MKAIQLDSDTADAITADTLRQHIKLVESNIRRLKKTKPLSGAQKVDLADDITILASMKDVLFYFTGK